MTKPFIMVGTPAYGNMVTVPYMTSVCDLKTMAIDKGIPLDIKTFGNESLITRARNNLVALFMANLQYTHLLFIDSDIGFNPESVFRMLSFDKEVVCGIYPQKFIDWNKVRQHAKQDEPQLQQRSLHYNLNVSDPNHVESQDGFIKALDGATGFMLIKRSVFEKMIQAFADLAYTPDYDYVSSSGEPLKYYALFDCIIDPETNRYLSEDYTFCRRWQKVGGEIWCDITSPLSHMGSYIFEGNIASQLTAK